VTGIRQRIGQQIKQREWFRPLAPAMRQDTFERFFPGAEPSPHMLFNFPAARLGILEATHEDGSARIQTVTAESNERLYQLLGSFEAMSGAPALLNTSLNAPGKAIAHTVEDVISDFLASGIDGFIFGDRLVLPRI
jgi:carbamoyltransferase